MLGTQKISKDQLEVQSKLRDAINAVCAEYRASENRGFFHRHGTAGKNRASTLETKINEDLDANDLEAAISRLKIILTSPKGGSSKHSLKTILLDRLSTLSLGTLSEYKGDNKPGTTKLDSVLRFLDNIDQYDYKKEVDLDMTGKSLDASVLKNK